MDDEMIRQQMEDLSGRNTVPQIFIGDHHVGGFDDLSALDKNGELDALLQSEPA
jgi:glutaredoxin 3